MSFVIGQDDHFGFGYTTLTSCIVNNRVLVFFLGISEENLAKLCEHAQIPSDYRFVNIYCHLFFYEL